MAGTTLDITEIINGRDGLAVAIANQWQTWNLYRSKWLGEKQELRNYLFATDTSTTTNSQNPWKNSTTLPKLAQIRDNLHANYMAALFPHKDWMSWEGADQDAVSKEKAQVIEAYLQNKILNSHFMTTVSELVLDFIDYGNCFGIVDWEADIKEDALTGETIRGYVGPKLTRISPNDIVFNPLAKRFEDTPVIVRSIVTRGELYAMVENDFNPEKQEIAREALSKMESFRKEVTATDQSDSYLNERYQFDGVGSAYEYFQQDSVEILTFYGDLYNMDDETLLKDHIVMVVDRNYIIYKKSNPSWLGKKPIYHASWRQRPDNLYGMGPLDNLVGMQYRIDHLENLKADVFDLIAQPVLKIRGDVEDFDYVPGERIYLGDDGDVVFLVPDTTALNAETQIQLLERKMEEMAGAPSEAMGIRTPGEKTAFEVQTIATSASRIFEHKTKTFEERFIEPALQGMLEQSRRNLDGVDVIRILDDETNAILFQEITREDITATGNIRPNGAAHFARMNQMAQSLNQLGSSAVYSDPSVNVHLSGVNMAKAIEEVTGLDRFDLFGENIRVMENASTQQMSNAANQVTMEEDAAGLGVSEEELIADAEQMV